jgi:hypothetical protein
LFGKQASQDGKMSRFDPEKLRILFELKLSENTPVFPRWYTLTHSDTTGELFLTIDRSPNRKQIAGWYTRFMRDEVLAEWVENPRPALHVYCHVSGGFVFGTPGWRNRILRYHMPMVLETFRYGDHGLFSLHPGLDEAPVQVHFQARQKRWNKVEAYGLLKDHGPQARALGGP